MCGMRMSTSNLQKEKNTKNKIGERNRDQERIDCGQCRSPQSPEKNQWFLNPAILLSMQNINETSCCFMLDCRSISNTPLNPEIWAAVLFSLSQVVTTAVATMLMIKKIYLGDTKSQQKLTEANRRVASEIDSRKPVVTQWIVISITLNSGSSEKILEVGEHQIQEKQLSINSGLINEMWKTSVYS